LTRSEILLRVADRINAVNRAHPVKVAVDGVDAAGKTMFADELAEILRSWGRDVIRASIDGFHNPWEYRHSRGQLNPEGYYLDSFNYKELLDNLLLPLSRGGDLNYRKKVFDYRKDIPLQSEPQRASEDAVLLFDGVFLMRPELFELWDLRIYLYITYEESLRRAIERDSGDPETIRKQYNMRYIPGQKLYHIHSAPKRKADILIDNNDLENPQIIN
jgi:uridine kinase